MCIVCVVPLQVKLQQFLSKLVDKFVARLHRWVCTHLWCLSCALVQLLEAIALALHGSSNLNAAYMHIRTYDSFSHTCLVWLVCVCPLECHECTPTSDLSCRERFAKPTWLPSTPESVKLTEEDIHAFVDCVLPAAWQCMFSRFGPMEAVNVFQQLAIVRPQKVLPGLLEK